MHLFTGMFYFLYVLDMLAPMNHRIHPYLCSLQNVFFYSLKKLNINLQTYNFVRLKLSLLQIDGLIELSQ